MPTPQELQQYQQLLNQFMPRQQQGITLGGLTSPQGLLGLGLLGGSFLGKEEPGYVTEARQNIRNVGTPTGYGNVFGQTVGGLQSQFQPLLQQQAELLQLVVHSLHLHLTTQQLLVMEVALSLPLVILVVQLVFLS